MQPGELTEEEQRAECMILIATEASDARDAIRKVALAHGGVVEVMARGTTVTLSSQRVATDQARFAARGALALQRELPETPMALVIGRRRVRATGATLALPTELRAAAVKLLGDGAAPGIHLDANVAGLLDVRFIGHGLVLRAELPGDDEARTLLGRPTAYVGRDQELGLLSSIFEVHRHRRGHRGVAGEDYPFSPVLYRTQAHALRALGDGAGADRLLALALRLVREQSTGIADPARRERFLDRGFGGAGLRNEVRRRLGEGAV